MGKPQHNEAFILEVLRSVGAGATVRAVCAQHGICEMTYRRWKLRYGDLDRQERPREVSSSHALGENMRKPKYSEAFILEVLGSVRAGTPVRYACRQHGICETTFHRWKARYADLELSEAERVKQFLEENRRLKALVADLTHENQALLGVLSQQSAAAE